MMVTSNVRLEQPLGAGGMGRVWIAEHLGLKTKVVVKFMTEELTKSGEGRIRFEREAAAAAQVRSPHVVQTFDHGVMADGVPYIVMELLEGRDLEDLLASEGPQPPAFVRDMVQQLCRALEKAHQAGIVHRDVKPSNVFLCDAGSGELFVKLLDFGIAKGTRGDAVSEVTKTGFLMGSPLYMSPEQIVGAKNIDHRSDLWAVGILTYQALTGHRPFEAETMGGLALKIVNDPLPLPTRVIPDLPADVDIWFARACARNVHERFASAKELSDALVHALQGDLSARIELPRSQPSPQEGRASSPSPVSRTLSNSDTVAADTGSQSSPRKPVATIAAIGALLVALGGAGLWFGAKGSGTAASHSSSSVREDPVLRPPTTTATLPSLALPPSTAPTSATVPPSALSSTAVPPVNPAVSASHHAAKVAAPPVVTVPSAKGTSAPPTPSATAKANDQVILQ